MNKSSRSRLSDSSRVSEKVMEYYMKYGKDRELEKFMRFRSPCGSQKSSETHSSLTQSSSSEDWTKVGNLDCLFHEKEVSSEECHNTAGPSTSKANKEHLVPIVIESDYDEDRFREEDEKSTKSPNTPQKDLNMDTKHTQTPESAAKCHKRLEWDSLGDVGYKKSKSTSNISIVERMLLREFFEVSTSSVKHTNSSENDIRLLEQEIADLGTLRTLFSKPKHTAMEKKTNYGTPPLASSTHIEKLEKTNQKLKVKPQVQTVGTNTTISKQKKEKYAQTSLKKPEMTCQEVQVTLTPPSITPLLGSSAEPSSFEYRSKNSTNSSETKSAKSSCKQDKFSEIGEMYHSAKESNETVTQRKRHEIKNDNIEVCERLKNMFITWNNVMEENKENASSSSSSCSNGSSPPQIDLGIQLICAIMKAKNIENKQKKRLVRNIVKRITKIANSCELDAIVSKTASLIECSSEDNKENSAAREKTDNRSSGGCSKSLTSKRMKNQGMSTEQNIAIPTSKLSATREAASTLAAIEKSNTENKKFGNKPQTLNLKATISGSIMEQSSSSSNKTSAENVTSSKNLSASTSKPASAPLTTKPSGKISTTSTKITTNASSSSSSTEPTPVLDISLCVSKTVSGGEIISAVIQPETNNGSSTTTSSTSTSSSSNLTKNLPTQKTTGKPSPVPGSNCLLTMDNGATQEWLNPMTQSEVEFEDKKRTLAPARKDRKTSGSATMSGKYAGLSWIDSEIKRLQDLKQILLNDGSSKSESCKILPKPLQENSGSSESSEKLYDTVFSDPSQSESRSTAGGIKTAQASTSKKESERPSDHNVMEKDAQKQRSKIDTPSGTTGSESVDSFVRQRKQEFLDHYKSQKLNHYDQIMHKYNQGQRTSRASAVAASQYQSEYGDHYSVPLPIRPSYNTYPPMQQTYRDPSYYTQTATVSKLTTSKKPTTVQHTLSSEISVPMGSYNSLSTPTTTHQYDLATMEEHIQKTTNIGSQTDRSLTRSRPIYETRCMSPYHAMVPRSNYVACTRTCNDVAKTVCIQVRPKGISYTLQFPSNATREKAGCSNTETSNSTSVEYKTLDKKAAPSLQLALKHGNPEFLLQAKKRKSILNRIQKLRLERERELREIADENTSLNSLDRKLGKLPPPAIEKLRLFPTKQMKALTNKRAAKLPEVLAKQELKREERYKRSNRLLREVFNRRLRERVRKGRLSLNHSHTLI